MKAYVLKNCNLCFLKGTCNAIGRKSGTCRDNSGETDCKCEDDFLSPTEFALCAAESTCRLDCQAKGFAFGEVKFFRYWAHRTKPVVQ